MLRPQQLTSEARAGHATALEVKPGALGPWRMKLQNGNPEIPACERLIQAQWDQQPAFNRVVQAQHLQYMECSDRS